MLVEYFKPEKNLILIKMNQHTEQETNIEDTHSSLEYIKSMLDTMFNILQHIQGQNKKIKKRCQFRDRTKKSYKTIDDESEQCAR